MDGDHPTLLVPSPPAEADSTHDLDTVLDQALTALSANSTAPDVAARLAQARQGPTGDHAHLIRAARLLGLDDASFLCLWLLIRAETDAHLVRRITALQSGTSPQGRPSLALLADLAALIDGPPTRDRAAALARGPLFHLPLVRLVGDASQPLAVTQIAPTAALLAALGLPSPLDLRPPDAPTQAPCIPSAYHQAALDLASRIHRRRVALLLRGGLPQDQRLFAGAMAEALGRPLITLPPNAQSISGLGAALVIAAALPFETVASQPGQRSPLADLSPLATPRLIALGEEGGVDLPGWDALDIALPALAPPDGPRLWSRLSTGHPPPSGLQGLGPSRIAAIAARLSLDSPPNPDPKSAFRAASAAEARPDIEPHGKLVRAHVSDAALIATPDLRAELSLLAARCLQRRDAKTALGPAFHARGPETGVRALFSGPSGSGKTLACSWLATKLGLPLFRVDLASVQSKYIGETEENLSRILDRAEVAEVILLFDEADSLFAARTETHDASDRFANNQTNFLLTRIESYSGIILLTTNARQRIDPAFSRRIDQVIEVPVPDPNARRAIWLAHLGQAHSLQPAEINRLASAAEIGGGHIRSIVQTAFILAQDSQSTDGLIGPDHILRALIFEYRKIGRTPPSLLVTGR